ncbi:putative fatty acid elongation protein 3 [Centruroides sculpturatus]|uniref:putative fatty acid elongation protein 3 n=1 Tax=Centruroides sculpturatus TaxID=218467 RepID=UPI000C6CFD2E|nr:putative fatty acid elongation protein 3 [Centruroides sculpturatus]
MMNYVRNQTIDETSLYSFHFGFERNFDVRAGKQWFKYKWHHCIYYIFAYLILIYGGQKYMKNRPPFNMKPLLIIWNLVLCTFHTLAAIRILPEFIYALYYFGFTYSICRSTHVELKTTTFWNLMFLWCKVPELFDTAFLIFRKRKIIFMHWFHHAVSLFVCWYIASEPNAVSRWYSSMNLAVHSLMYGYYAVTSMQISMPKFVPMFVTTMQILQMILATFVTVWSFVYFKLYRTCELTESRIYVALFIYTLYCYLFVRFFYNAYLQKSISKKKVSHME